MIHNSASNKRPTPPISRFDGLSPASRSGREGGECGGGRGPGAPRTSRGSRARGRRAGPVTRRRKNASDPTRARFRDAGNIWGVCAGRLGKYLLPNLARRCPRIQTHAGLNGGDGAGTGWQPCQLPGCTLESEPVASTWVKDELNT